MKLTVAKFRGKFITKVTLVNQFYSREICFVSKLTLDLIWLNIYEGVLNQNCIWVETQLFLTSLN